jgi:hypothetical protein
MFLRSGFNGRLYCAASIFQGANHAPHLGSDPPMLQEFFGAALAAETQSQITRVDGCGIKKVRQPISNIKIERLGISQQIRNSVPCGPFLSTVMVEISVIASYGIDPPEQEHFDHQLKLRNGFISGTTNVALISRRGRLGSCSGCALAGFFRHGSPPAPP